MVKIDSTTIDAIQDSIENFENYGLITDKIVITENSVEFIFTEKIVER